LIPPRASKVLRNQPNPLATLHRSFEIGFFQQE